jgi:hypothetical protein
LTHRAKYVKTNVEREGIMKLRTKILLWVAFISIVFFGSVYLGHKLGYRDGYAEGSKKEITLPPNDPVSNIPPREWTI